MFASAETTTETPLSADEPSEQLFGQSSELACQLEDAPSEVLQGQSVQMACLVGYPELCEGVVLEAPAGYRHEGEDDRLLPIQLIPIASIPTLVTISEVGE